MIVLVHFVKKRYRITFYIRLNLVSKYMNRHEIVSLFHVSTVILGFHFDYSVMYVTYFEIFLGYPPQIGPVCLSCKETPSSSICDVIAVCQRGEVRYKFHTQFNVDKM